MNAQHKNIPHKGADSFSPKAYAFSLIELMVVLAVIAVLAGLLYPNYVRQVEKGRGAICKSNLKQFISGFNNYLSESRGRDGAGSQIPAGTAIGVDVMFAGGRYADAKWGDKGIHRVGPAGDGDGIHSWIGDFVFPYVRKTKTSFYDANHTRAGEPPFFPGDDIAGSGCYCPATYKLLSVFNEDNYATSTNSKTPYFKGYNLYQFSPTPVPNQGDQGRFCTYAKNESGNVAGQHRARVPGNVLLFCDWNPLVGWNGSINYMQDNKVCSFGYTLADQGRIRFETPYPCKSEVGFHHVSGTQSFANAATYDGRVISIPSNEITLVKYWE